MYFHKHDDKTVLHYKIFYKHIHGDNSANYHLKKYTRQYISIIIISLHIFIHYNCKNSFLSVTAVPETQLDKPDVDVGFELVLNRKQRINCNI